MSEQEHNEFLQRLTNCFSIPESEATYPVSDPNWDYVNIDRRMQQARLRLSDAIAQVSNLETATRESDDRLEAQLSEIRELLQWRSPGGNRYRVG